MLNLLSLAVILSYYCLMHVHGDCTAGQISIIQQQWADTFNTPERLRQFAQTYFERSAILYESIEFVFCYDYVCSNKLGVGYSVLQASSQPLFREGRGARGFCDVFP